MIPFDHRTYDLLLDLFPLCSSINDENPVLGTGIQHAALQLLLDERDAGRLRTLLMLSRDLGYLDDEVHSYLVRQLDQIGIPS